MSCVISITGRYQFCWNLKMRKANGQADSSDSEDEVSASVLREAIDQQFLNDDLYVARRAEIVPESSK